MSLNLSGVITSLGLKKSIMVERYAAATYVKGDAVKPEPTTFACRALIGPLPDRELLRLPEGDRNRETLVCYTKVELKTSSLSDETLPDVVLYDGARFEVVREGDWIRQAKVYRSVIAKQEEN